MIISIFFLILFFLKLVLFWFFFSYFRTFLSIREAGTVFECGFDGKDKSRTTFSLRFFLLILLFLVFDVELVFLIQIPWHLGILNRLFFSSFYRIFFFLTLLLIATLEEWRRGILKWKK